MSAAALWDFLPDFGRSNDNARHEPVDASAEARVAAPDVDALIAQAVFRAEAELGERMAQEHAAQLAVERENAALEAQALLQSLGTDLGELVSARMDQVQDQLCEAMGAAAARTIGGVLTETLRERSLAELARTVATTLADTETMRIEVRGPAHLFETFSRMLGDRAGRLAFTEAPGFDLTVSIDETVIETRMNEWSAALSGMLS